MSGPEQFVGQTVKGWLKRFQAKLGCAGVPVYRYTDFAKKTQKCLPLMCLLILLTNGLTVISVQSHTEVPGRLGFHELRRLQRRPLRPRAGEPGHRQVPWRCQAWAQKKDDE